MRAYDAASFTARDQLGRHLQGELPLGRNYSKARYTLGRAGEAKGRSMTLIASLLTSEDCLAVSDLLVSRPASPSPTAIELPLATGKVSHLADGYAPTTLVQKAVVRNRTMIQCAGSLLVCRVVIKEILKQSDDGTLQVDISNITHGLCLSDAELASISLIYWFCSPPKDITIQGFNTDSETDGQSLYIMGGTGLWPFFHNTDLGDTTSPTEAYKNFLTRAMYHLCSERYIPSNYDFLYGGWFEICRRHNGLPEKMRYAVMFWQQGSNNVAQLHDLNPTGLYFCNYDGPDLIVSSIDFTDGKYRRRNFFVPSLLDRQIRRHIDLPYKPDIVFHSVHGVEHGSMFTDTSARGVSFDFHSNGVPRSMHFNIDFMKELRSSLDSGNIISHPFLDPRNG